MKATILKGLPWSGKSTYAKTLWCLIISKDILRKQYPDADEKTISSLQKEQIINAKQDIVIDNTHMNPRTLQSTIDICKQEWYEVEVVDMIDKYNKLTYLSECHNRNKWREWEVPWSVIDYMYLMNYWTDGQYYIFDIDWTIAKMDSERRQALDNKDYDTFYWDLVLKDEPIKQAISILKCLYASWACIVLVSWRSNQCYLNTVERLSKNNISYDFLLMRNKWDHRPDYQIKLDIYKNCLSSEECLWVFDDRDSVIWMRRSLGLFTFDVSQWNWNF